VTKDAVQRRSWTFYEAINFKLPKNAILGQPIESLTSSLLAKAHSHTNKMSITSPELRLLPYQVVSELTLHMKIPK